MEPPHRPRPVFDWLARSVTEDLGLKVLSLLVALGLFGLVRGAGNVQRSLEVSLIARLPAAGARRVLLTDLPDRVRITVSGSPTQVGAIRPDALGQIQLDLSEGRRASVYLDAAALSFPAGVRLVQVQPASLQLQWDDFVERPVPVRVEMSGMPATGTHVVGDVEIVPRSVRVSGPALFVGAINMIRTDALDVTGLPAGRHERRLPLESVRAGVAVDAPAGIRVTFVVDREIVERRFEQVSVTSVGAGNVDVRPPSVTVILRGAPSAMSAVVAQSLVPTIEVPIAPAARTNVRARVTLAHVPPDVSLVGIDPPEVIVVAGR